MQTAYGSYQRWSGACRENMVNNNNIKSAVLLLHIDPSEKELLMAAAARGGKTLTEFVTGAALKQARSSECASLAPVRDGPGLV
jgi:predicted HicB family RNase H-like nuclease